MCTDHGSAGFCTSNVTTEKKSTGKHIETRELTPNFNQGEIHCKRLYDRYDAVDIEDYYAEAVKYHYCCHGGHGKRKANVANYVRYMARNSS